MKQYSFKIAEPSLNNISVQLRGIYDAENTGGHAVDTWTGLLIDLIYNFDIANLIWMDLNIWDWKATSRHVEIWDKGLSWKALRLKQDFRSH
jgi:hypothetical protein